MVFFFSSISMDLKAPKLERKVVKVEMEKERQRGRVMKEEQMETLRKQITVYTVICDQLRLLHKSLSSNLLPLSSGVNLFRRRWFDPMVASSSAHEMSTRHRWTLTSMQLQILERIYKEGSGTPNAQRVREITTELFEHGQITEKSVEFEIPKLGLVYYLLIIFASFWSGCSFVTFVSGLVPNVMLSYMVTFGYLSYCLLFSGFYINRDRIHLYWIWIHYISLLKYPYEAVLHNEFDDPSSCFVRGGQVFDNTLMKSVSEMTKGKVLETMSSYLGMDLTESTCLRTASELLKEQGIEQLGKWGCLWVTLARGCFFRSLFYFSLLLGSKNKRT